MSNEITLLDHEQFVTARPEHVKDLIVNMHMHNEDYLVRADDVIGRIRKDKKLIEARFKEPVSLAYQAHKKLTKERNEMLENLDWAENLLKDKMKRFHMENDRKALAEAEVTTTSITPPEPRSKLKHTTFVEKWKYKIVDLKKLPKDYMMPDEKKIATTVRSMGELTKIKGVQVYRDYEVRIST